MSQSNPKRWQPRLSRSICAVILAFSMLAYVPAGYANDEQDRAADRKTASPIKHVIIMVGENRSFDHIFATYVPRHGGETVRNLLSEGIVNADGSPGPHFARAQQFQIVSAPNGGKFFSSAAMANKQLYPTLPPPDLAGVAAISPAIGILSLPGGRSRLGAPGSIPLWNGRFRLERQPRSGYSHFQRQQPAAWTVPTDWPDHAL